MRAGFDQHLIARLRVQPHGKLVGHRPGRHKHRRLLAQKLGGEPLQLIDGGIIAKDIIADRGLGDRPPHRGRGLRDGIAAQVDHDGVSVTERLVDGPVIQHV